MTHPGTAKAVFTGRIVSSAPMTFKPWRLEKGDAITLSADKKTLTYKFNNYGRIDGIDFKTACAQRLTIFAALNGRKLSPSRIWLGQHGRHPLENRFVVVKIASSGPGPGDTTAAVGDDRRRPMSARSGGVSRAGLRRRLAACGARRWGSGRRTGRAPARTRSP